jgi:hypothetical protein
MFQLSVRLYIFSGKRKRGEPLIFIIRETGWILKPWDSAECRDHGIFYDDRRVIKFDKGRLADDEDSRLPGSELVAQFPSPRIS